MGHQCSELALLREEASATQSGSVKEGLESCFNDHTFQGFFHS